MHRWGNFRFQVNIIYTIPFFAFLCNYALNENILLMITVIFAYGIGLPGVPVLSSFDHNHPVKSCTGFFLLRTKRGVG